MTSQDRLTKYIHDNNLSQGKYIAFLTHSYSCCRDFEHVQVALDIDDAGNIEYDYDFCEGQEYVSRIKVVDFFEVAKYYEKNKLEWW